METGPEEKNLRMLSFVTHATRGLIRDRKVRRKLMIATVLVAFGMLIAGSTVLHGVLNPREHPVWFILFWFACGWLTLLAILLAIFDVLIVRTQAHAARRVLRGEFSKPPNPSGDE